ncbi:MAG: cytochrome c [Rhodospirillaceae bacterium]
MRKKPLLILAFLVLCVLAVGAGNAIRKAVDPSVAESGNPLLAGLGKSLKGLVTPPPPPPGARPSEAKQVALGAKLYAANCATCHGDKLQGEPNWRYKKADGTLPAPPHDASGHTWHHNDQLLFDYTKQGGQALAPEGFKSGMPAFSGTLSDDDIWAVLAFIKSRWPKEILARQNRLNR